LVRWLGRSLFIASHQISTLCDKYDVDASANAMKEYIRKLKYEKSVIKFSREGQNG